MFGYIFIIVVLLLVLGLIGYCFYTKVYKRWKEEDNKEFLLWASNKFRTTHAPSLLQQDFSVDLATNTETKYNDYSNGKYGFSVKYPVKWKFSDPSSELETTCCRIYDTGNELRQRSLLISYETCKWPDINMKEFGDAALEKIKKLRYKFKLIERKIKIFENGECPFISFVHESDWGKRFSIILYISFEKTIFSLLFDSPDNTRTVVEPIFMEMLKSFRIIPSLASFRYIDTPFNVDSIKWKKYSFQNINMKIELPNTWIVEDENAYQVIHINCPTTELYFKAITVVIFDLSNVGSSSILGDLAVFFKNFISNNLSAHILEEQNLSNAMHYRCNVINNMINIISYSFISVLQGNKGYILTVNFSKSIAVDYKNVAFHVFHSISPIA